MARSKAGEGEWLAPKVQTRYHANCMSPKRTKQRSKTEDASVVKILRALDRRLASLERRLKEDRHEDNQREERLMRHVDVRFEDLRSDLFGAVNDRYAALEYRLVLVEQKVGLAS